jgi:hypothetical protein
VIDIGPVCAGLAHDPRLLDVVFCRTAAGRRGRGAGRPGRVRRPPGRGRSSRRAPSSGPACGAAPAWPC